MTTYFVTRHDGALEWLKEQGMDACRVTHLDLSIVKPGDIVMGTLPIHLAADVIERGARYVHLTLDVPPERRGQELTADDMTTCGARLEEFQVHRLRTLQLKEGS